MALPVSLICTVLNEVDNIGILLESVYSMKRQPDEFIIVDGGSIDGTVQTLNAYSKKYPNFRYIIEKGCNIARGRNVAIRHAKFNIIAVIDAGARPCQSWLEEILLPLETDDSVQVVAGWTQVDSSTIFQKWVGMLQRPIGQINLDKYLPSARSLAMKKKCWEAVGGFPEELTNWGEDTVFIKRLKNAGFRFALAEKAVVSWQARKNLDEYWQQYFHYGLGDGEAGIDLFLNLKRLVFVLSPVLLLIGILSNLWITLIALIIVILAFYKLMLPLVSDKVSAWQLFPLFGLVLISESAQVCGYLTGLLRMK